MSTMLPKVEDRRQLFRSPRVTLLDFLHHRPMEAISFFLMLSSYNIFLKINYGNIH